ncbi:MAG: sulfite oxidase [Lewinellaceae bacterium]|nr:sulfite oxidase [Lewinella sp.]MCB9278589.1 sulfite oxidase [Lewinellaceae bacterium]
MKRKQPTRSRRDFIRQSAFFSLGASLTPNLPVWPSTGLFAPDLPEKHPGLIVLGDRPVNAETPPHLLDDPLTPNDKFFVRNNGLPPQKESIDLKTWTLTIDGESVKQKKTYTLQELKSKFQHHTYQLVLECAGNGRKEFNPPAHGNQWSVGAVGCAAWTGVRLKDVLNDAGIKSDAVYIGYYGKDSHLNGGDEPSISRGVPMSKALEDESLIAWAMNGKDIPLLNGFPLRLVFGGWPASCSGKWLSRIAVRNIVHDGPKMGGDSYRVPCHPVAPGAKVEDQDMCIIESMPVKSVIAYPKTGATIRKGQKMPLRGHAWAGDTSVRSVFYSVNFGRTWEPCKVSPQANRNAWQQFETEIAFPDSGYYEVWARAVDAQGNSQPMLLPGWNPKGYLNNACHRIAVKVS